MAVACLQGVAVAAHSRHGARRRLPLNGGGWRFSSVRPYHAAAFVRPRARATAVPCQATGCTRGSVLVGQWSDLIGRGQRPATHWSAVLANSHTGAWCAARRLRAGSLVVAIGHSGMTLLRRGGPSSEGGGVVVIVARCGVILVLRACWNSVATLRLHLLGDSNGQT